jgi:hypothetical protein
MIMHIRSTLMLLAFAGLFQDGAIAQAADPNQITRNKIMTLGVPFVPNVGQWHADAAFAAHTFTGTMFVGIDGTLIYSLPGVPKASLKSQAAQSALEKHESRSAKGEAITRGPGWVLSERLVDADGRAPKREQLLKPVGFDLMPGKLSYHLGTAPQIPSPSIPSYAGIDLGSRYPGVRLLLRATGTNVEKIFTIAPKQDPNQIRIQVDGATKLEIGAQGELIAHTGNGAVRFTAPVAFQDHANGARQIVKVAYRLDRKRGNAKRYGFSLGTYDRSLALTIDPLLQSTYLGGSGADFALALAVHPNGEVYAAGQTNSVNFPGATGAQPINAGGTDAFVARFDSSLTTRLQTSYLGGSLTDTATALAFDRTSGDVLVAGVTRSSNFPGVEGGAQTIFGGGNSDAFVTRFNASLSMLLQSSYVGGEGADEARALGVHPTSGEVLIAGQTTDSPNFPGTLGGAQNANAGGADAFVTRISASLGTILQSSYLGGAEDDFAAALAIDPGTGDVYIAGATRSVNLPAATGAQTTFGGGVTDGYVSRLNSTLTTLIQSSYLGGAANDSVTAIAIHPQNAEVFLTGQTESTNFPGMTNAPQSVIGGSADAFVSRFNASLGSRLQSSYLGGTLFDFADALAINPANGEVVIAGSTRSSNFPGARGGAQSSFAGGTHDAFVARFSANLGARPQTSYLGGGLADFGYALALDASGAYVYVSGETSATNFPKVIGGAQISNAGGQDAFISRLTSDLVEGVLFKDGFEGP